MTKFGSKKNPLHVENLMQKNFKIQDLKAKLQDKNIAIRVIPTTSISRSQLKITHLEDRVMHNNSEVKTKEVEDHCTVRFGNDQFALILRYGDLVQGNVTIKKVYYVEGINHNLFYVGRFCDADLEVAFRKSTCYVRDLKGNDLLTGSSGTDLYLITLQGTTSPNPICLLSKASSSQAWLWHYRLSHLNFDTINFLSKYDIVTSLPKLKFLLHVDLCGPMRVESINVKKYVLVIVDDYSRYTWTHFLRSIDKKPEVLIDFLRLIQRGLHAQNDVVERRNHTLVEAARTMLSAAKVSLFFWDEAIATTCFTQDRSLIIPQHEKILYHIINGRKPIVKFFHIFGSLCYLLKYGENFDKMKEKDETITTSLNELDMLFSPMFVEYFKEASLVVSKSSVVSTVDASDKCHQSNTTLSTSTTVVAYITQLNI
ncbi:retrovirus-related pol polyprotein from transposon TNT 1-94 [Tanacetum coccineum]